MASGIFNGLRTSLKPLLGGAVGGLQAAGFVIWFHDYVGVESMVISGPSMLPTFNQPRLAGDIVLIERFSFWLPLWLSSTPWLPESLRDGALGSGMIRGLKRGDVVLAYSPVELNKLVCKRLVAMEGDFVEVPRDHSALAGKKVLVPKGHVWLEGDCPHVSRDSREYGPVPLSLMHGRAWFQVWPPWSMGWVNNKEPPQRQ